jgi:dolichyldiphosphatase
MGFFASFLICHLYFRQRFTTGTGNRPLDSLGRPVLYSGILLWAVSVAYSRYYLQYHTPRQILWGFFIGVLFGLCTYVTTELIPTRRPYSTLGKVRRWVLVNRLSVWLEIRDGWAVWGDAGRAEEWKRWRDRWERESRRGD